MQPARPDPETLITSTDEAHKTLLLRAQTEIKGPDEMNLKAWAHLPMDVRVHIKKFIYIIWNNWQL